MGLTLYPSTRLSQALTNRLRTTSLYSADAYESSSNTYDTSLYTSGMNIRSLGRRSWLNSCSMPACQSLDISTYPWCGRKDAATHSKGGPESRDEAGEGGYATSHPLRLGVEEILRYRF